jgi:hypothetical protein
MAAQHRNKIKREKEVPDCVSIAVPMSIARASFKVLSRRVLMGDNAVTAASVQCRRAFIQENRCPRGPNVGKQSFLFVADHAGAPTEGNMIANATLRRVHFAITKDRPGSRLPI